MKMNATTINKQVQLVCPICKSEKYLNLPESIINQSAQLTTISIPNGLVCSHHFQAFVDKQFKVRGYQKVDFELKPKIINNKETDEKKEDKIKKRDNELFKNLILEGNYLEYNPKKRKNLILNNKNGKISPMEKKEMSLEEIYEEFWEFIDDNNYEFKELILKDRIRRKALKNSS
jgi:hypothetical protein